MRQKFDEHTKIGPIIAKHVGRYLTQGGSHKILEKGERRDIGAGATLKDADTASAFAAQFAEFIVKE
jgi:uncharacterized protein (DUF1330 family)